MLLKINNTEFRHFSNIDVQLTFECVASAFSADLYFDPTVAEHRAVFRPDAYARFELYDDNNILLITGTLLRMSFVSSAVPGWVRVSGYSTTGVLEDCEIPLSCYPLQTNNLTLLQICERLCRQFGINVVVDASVSASANSKIVKTTASESQSVKAYLSELCSYKQIMLSHTPKGELLLTSANTGQLPISSFTESNTQKGYSFSLDFNGQSMHSEVGVVRQATKAKGGGLTGQTVFKNPYVPVFRTAVKRQSSGDRDRDTSTTARNVLSDELRNIELVIEIEGFYLNNTLVRPGMLLSIQNPELYLFNPTLFFIETVVYKQTEREASARLICYLPEVYNSATPKNIFD